MHIKFNYPHAMKKYMPLEIHYDGMDKGAKLAWYTREVEQMTVDNFLTEIARKINKKYNVTQSIE